MDALKGLIIARDYTNYGLTSSRDLGCMDREWSTIDLRNALNRGRFRRHQSAGAARACLRQQLDQDDEQGRLFQSRR